MAQNSDMVRPFTYEEPEDPEIVQVDEPESKEEEVDLGRQTPVIDDLFDN